MDSEIENNLWIWKCENGMTYGTNILKPQLLKKLFHRETQRIMWKCDNEITNEQMTNELIYYSRLFAEQEEVYWIGFSIFFS